MIFLVTSIYRNTRNDNVMFPNKHATYKADNNNADVIFDTSTLMMLSQILMDYCNSDLCGWQNLDMSSKHRWGQKVAESKKSSVRHCKIWNKFYSARSAYGNLD